ncbi:MAG: PHP domain-containing protein [Herpetosiphonaceae bacterium]|nr:PHP domain-containing protein [Herpetosiphonaceae bacterium]
MNWLPKNCRGISTTTTTCLSEQKLDPMLPVNRADLHVHTSASDGLATVEQVLAQVATAGKLRVVAITDHDAMLDAVRARRLQRDFGVEVIVGEEVSTQEGHLLALFIDHALPPGRPAAETIAAIHAQGGLCIAPHPYDWLIPSLGKAGLRTRCVPHDGAADGRDWPFDAIETLNASITWPASVANAWAQYVAVELGLPVVGGSDTHTLATVGQAYTEFCGTTAEDVYRSIKEGTVAAVGHCWSPTQFLEFYQLTLRRRSLSGALKLACANVTLLHKAVA